ncbi:rhamnose ABC transporter substrate-binding protein [Nesterenkonia halotolerans]|uniref:Rhamnose transport system substrate-binding protein n=1 Tax=Nesterenkonia halotolerans TaxID=225325 RepID=A0ABR9J7T5_9MICC|nr:rhamnose ABC transporter substrate-binding protein [Nesterenkonia halotolerans]MBE1515062.1 rhamnose transport system substrate-binding protein [Nesterenkonia halotolerans]
MRTNAHKRSVPALAVFAVGALALTSCGGDNGDGGGGDGEASGEELNITFLPKNLGNPYFETSNAGGEEAVEEFGGTYSEVGPQEATPDGQVEYINTAAQQGEDALVLSANDPSAICGALNEARDVDVAVVTFDSDTDAECRDLFVNQATAEGIASAQVQLVAEQIDEEGEIAILSASANATNQNLWIELMEEEIAADYPDIEIVDTVYGDDDDQRSFDQTAALLQTHSDLDAIVSPTTVGIAAAARYISDSDYAGEVAVTGLGTPNQMREYVEDGTVEAFALWNPEDLGYLSAWAANALASGEIEGEEGDTFEAGRLGEYTVGADGEVVLGEPFVFNSENIGDFDF